MRALCLIMLLVLLGAVGLFAYQNLDMVTIHYLDRSVSVRLAILIGGVYLAGMLTGWTVVGVLRRSIVRVAEPSRREIVA
jgi:lipopolysaccharide assembly protein A